jgi:TRAP-type C4-dicarboxylate transport system substrate-binding protein
MAVGLATLGVGAASAQQFHWKLQSIETPTMPGAAHIMRPWLDKIKKDSGGRLDITLFTAGQLIPSDEILNGLKSGIIEMAWTSPLYTTGAVPESFLNPAAFPPMLLKRSQATRDLYWGPGGIDEILRKAYLRENAYYLNTIFAGGSIAIWSCKKPIHTIEDLKGFKFRSFGKVATVFERLGAAPVAMPHPEVYSAISQGIIDGSTGGSALFEANKYYELCKYFYTRPVLEVDALAFMVSKPAWDKLPPDLKELLKKASMEYSGEYEKLTDRLHAEMLAKMPKWGVQKVEWSDEFVDRVRDEGRKMLPEMEASPNPGLVKGVKMIEAYVNTQK